MKLHIDFGQHKTLIGNSGPQKVESVLLEY